MGGTATKVRRSLLSDMAAQARWLLEREGLDPEKFRLVLVAPDDASRHRVEQVFLRDIDKRVMIAGPMPGALIAHGLPIWVMTTTSEKAK